MQDAELIGIISADNGGANSVKDLAAGADTGDLLVGNVDIQIVLYGFVHFIDRIVQGALGQLLGVIPVTRCGKTDHLKGGSVVGLSFDGREKCLGCFFGSCTCFAGFLLRYGTGRCGNKHQTG